jgi:acetyl-CoA carboxylase biotin carboxyl carrier protein
VSGIDEDLIISLSKLLDKTGLSEIEIENKSVGRVKVAKNNYQPSITMATDLNRQESNSGINNSEENNEIKNAVLSPMVGTVYLRPDPESQTFINEGDKVKKGQTLLIIEAMKTMNNISAENDGTVKKILVENEQPIQFGDPLLIIE